MMSTTRDPLAVGRPVKIADENESENQRRRRKRDTKNRRDIEDDGHTQSHLKQERSILETIPELSLFNFVKLKKSVAIENPKYSLT